MALAILGTSDAGWNAEILRYLCSQGVSLYDANGVSVIFAILNRENDHEDEENFERTSTFFDDFFQLVGLRDVTDQSKTSLLEPLIERGWQRLAARTAQVNPSAQ